MAIVTMTVASFADSQVLLQVDYDDVALQLLTLRCINNTSKLVRCEITAVSDPTHTYGRTFPANQTVELAVPQGALTRLAITIDARGRLNGVDYQPIYPFTPKP